MVKNRARSALRFAAGAVMPAGLVVVGCSGDPEPVPNVPIPSAPPQVSASASAALPAPPPPPAIEGVEEFEKGARPLPKLDILRPGHKAAVASKGKAAKAVERAPKESTKLEVGYTESKLNDKTIFVRTYNGKLVGPTLRARPGETMFIELVNKLPNDPEDPAGEGHSAHAGHGGGDVNKPHGFNVTNLHVHGLHVRPDYPSQCDRIPPKDRPAKCPAVADNVLIDVAPGKSQRYEIEIPANHPPGTHWYHAHKHGSVAMQLASGIAGALVIEGGLDDLPEIKNADEEVMVFQQLTVSPCGRKTVPVGSGPEICKVGTTQYESCDSYFDRLVKAGVLPSYPKGTSCVESFDLSFGPGKWAGVMVPQFGNRTSINGVVVPTITVKQGKLLRWRLVDAGIRESIQLGLVRYTDLKSQAFADPNVDSLADPTALAARLDLAVISYDGIATGRLDRVKQVELQPGYRADVLARIDAPGDYALIDLSTLPGRSLQAVAEPLEIVAKVHVDASADKPSDFPSADALAKLAPYKHVEDSEVKGCQYNTFNIDLSSGSPKFQVNAHAYDPNAPPRTMTLNTADEWVVDSKLANHPFHIHVNPFEVVDGYGPFPKGTWKDTLLVFGPAGGQPSKPFRLRSRYENFTGKFVLHCHILDHEDQGMMQTVDVLPPGSTSSACPTLCSGPGCKQMCELTNPPPDGKCPGK